MTAQPDVEATDVNAPDPIRRLASSLSSSGRNKAAENPGTEKAIAKQHKKAR